MVITCYDCYEWLWVVMIVMSGFSTISAVLNAVWICDVQMWMQRCFWCFIRAVSRICLWRKLSYFASFQASRPIQALCILYLSNFTVVPFRWEMWTPPNVLKLTAFCYSCTLASSYILVFFSNPSCYISFTVICLQMPFTNVFTMLYLSTVFK